MAPGAADGGWTAWRRRAARSRWTPGRSGGSRKPAGCVLAFAGGNLVGSAPGHCGAGGHRQGFGSGALMSGFHISIPEGGSAVQPVKLRVFAVADERAAKYQLGLELRAAELVARSAPLAGLAFAQATMLFESWMTSPSSVTSTGTMFWLVSSRTLRRVGLSVSPSTPQP